MLLGCNAGAVYTWGQNQDGQLGLGDCQGRGTPTLIEDTALETQNVVKVVSHTSSIILGTFLRGGPAHAFHLTMSGCYSTMWLPR